MKRSVKITLLSVAGVAALAIAAAVTMRTHRQQSYLKLLRAEGGYPTVVTEAGAARARISRVPNLVERNRYASTIPAFTYQDSGHLDLQKIRERFALDSIAGRGDQLSRVKNVMYWLHNSVRHDGSNSPDCPRNMAALYDYAAQTGSGINCRMLAIALNECYLALGYASRYVTCMPKDPADEDCHVINAVWIDSLHRWIWIDPTFAAYVTDEEGIPLGVRHVRERLRDGRPLRLNPDANRNNEERATREEYLDRYMAKNLFWLVCPAGSRADAETRGAGPQPVYVALCPAGFDPSGSYEVTRNPDLFWEAPARPDPHRPR